MRSRLALLPILAVLLFSFVGEVEAEQVKGTVVMHDGRTFKDCIYEVRGKRVWVKRDLGEATYALHQVKSLIPAADESGEDVAVMDLPEGADWETRFLIEPPTGWAIAKSGTPLVRGMLRHSSRDAKVYVAVTAVDGDSEEWGELRSGLRLNRAATEEIQGNIKRFYQRAGKPQPSITTYKGAPVIRFKLGVTPYGAGRGDRLSLEQVRFRRHGYEYAVTFEVNEKDKGALAHEVDEVLDAFSFLPEMMITKTTYSDYARGFALVIPDAEWTMKPKPFSEGKPLVLETGKGRGEVAVRLYPGSDAAAVVEREFKRRKKSKHFKDAKTKVASQFGSEVVRFKFVDFKTEGRKELLFKGFAAALTDSVIMVTGIIPRSDEDAKRIAGDVDAILASVRLQDPKAIKARIGKGKDALDYVAEGAKALEKRSFGEAISSFSKAIEADPDYAFAYYLRAEAKKSNRDFDGYKEDLELAEEKELAGYGDALASADLEEANAALKAKDYVKGLPLWSRIYNRTKPGKEQDNAAKQVVTCAKTIWRDLKKKDPAKGVKLMESRLKSVNKAPPVQEWMVSMYGEAVGGLLGEGQDAKAGSMVSKARRLARSLRNDKLITQVERLKARIEQKKAQDKKRKKSGR